MGGLLLHRVVKGPSTSWVSASLKYVVPTFWATAGTLTSVLLAKTEGEDVLSMITDAGARKYIMPLSELEIKAYEEHMPEGY